MRFNCTKVLIKGTAVNAEQELNPICLFNLKKLLKILLSSAGAVKLAKPQLGAVRLRCQSILLFYTSRPPVLLHYLTRLRRVRPCLLFLEWFFNKTKPTTPNLLRCSAALLLCCARADRMEGWTFRQGAAAPLRE